ncbi:sigma-54 interaction domain-containing protein [Moorella sulfitireducens]|uniref:sigma-54 interaction domain-containing protein n=1 Tax=Neomoorella sulfitireducens TaxID=2972948 RepID=UPI0021AD1072|nr:sigma 54-interacting transcriptional regulator [Moorella sulfitireducens]
MNLDNNFFKKVLDSMSDGVLVVNRDLDIIYANASYARISNLTLKEVIGQKLTTFVENPLLPKVMKTGTPINSIRKKVIGNTNAYVSMSPLIINGEVIGGISVFKTLEDVNQTLAEYSRKIKQMRNRIVHTDFKATFTFRDIIGQSPKITKVIQMAKNAALKDISILLLGESGTGKEIFAQAIHNASLRNQNAFVSLNCACLPPHLVESELFGYESGSFSGALKNGKLGLYEIADGGTLFLDEIGDLDLNLQAKLLRVLETGQFLRVGGTQPITVDVRIIAATNRNLERLIAEGKFREDLYYRLCVIPMEIPPLRERLEDIPLLANYFLEKISNKKITFDPKTIKFFQNYSWPGNVRELRNTILAMVNFTESSVLLPEHLPPKLVKERAVSLNTVNDSSVYNLHQIEINIIREKLRLYGKSVTAKRKIASELGISLATLYNKIRKYGI